MAAVSTLLPSLAYASPALLVGGVAGLVTPMRPRFFPRAPPALLLEPAALSSLSHAAALSSSLSPSLSSSLSPSVSSAPSALEAVSSALAFADQSGKLAGTFFQASLLPYLAFVYFLGYPANRTPKVALFGHQYLLLFVLSTVFTGIVTKSTYGATLADVDWLHGAAEALLTTSNLYVAYGYRNAMAGEPDPEGGAFRYPGFAIFALVAAATALGPSVLGLETHSAFLAGLGNLPENPLAQLAQAEPVNALSIPTWAIHFSSVFEWLLAMSLVSTFALATGNEKWRGLTWGMLPLHASGVAACTYHFFYNSPDVGFLVTLQAGLTLLGNTTVAIAALLIALSNGWTINELNPFKNGNPFAQAKAMENAEPAERALPPLALQPMQSSPLLAVELIGLTLAASYLIKYGETTLGFPFRPNEIVAWLMVLSIPASVGFNLATASPEKPRAASD